MDSPLFICHQQDHTKNTIQFSEFLSTKERDGATGECTGATEKIKGIGATLLGVKDKKGETSACRGECMENFISIYKYLKEAAKWMEPRYSQWHPVTGHRAMACVQYNRVYSITEEIPSENQLTAQYCVVERALGHVEVCLLGNIKRLSIHSRGQPALNDISRTRELGRQTSRSPLLT